ncbi:DUF2088 domain-containing protein [Ktedonosporobacter rubrisoli]|uniref:DUF2088 domain-containing protein n=2 Tax=Ktedonosporobacter rubrisoli TaxID=2509675 RepID=A0A4P6K5L5_KTERU|nr:DUF2088 domain-containing protein [Ktedonosporobacter rubrisoli]
MPEGILHQLLDPVAIPEMARVRNVAPTAAPIEDIGAAVHEQMLRSNVGVRFQPGQRVAIGVGSRGIGKLAEIVAALVSELRALGAEPFIFPAMGSHGGATAEGQREVLTHLGITPERVGAPIESQMETVEVGKAADGTSVRLDRLALAADGIVFVGRIKPHTAFRGTYESGLAKMIAIGLGKQEGAAACHARGFGEMARMVPLLAQVALAKAPIRFGLAVLENAHDQPYKLLVVPAEQIMEREPALLEEAKQAMPRIAFKHFDVLVIDEIGKNISGDGADPNITGRYPTPHASGGPEVNKQVVLDLCDASDGNANGIGTADFTTVRLAHKMDLGRTYPNALTSTVPRPVALPMVLPSDRLAIAAGLLTCHAVGREPRLVRIKNTLSLDEYWISRSLLAEAEQEATLSVISQPQPMAFDQAGNLQDLQAKIR